MKVAPPKTPQEIRDLIRLDVSLAKDQHLLALLLAQGSVGRQRGRPRKSRSSLELAVALLESAGGGWVHLVETAHADAVDLASFGIRASIGARLVAGTELSRRWRCGFKDGGDANLRPIDEEELQRRVLQRQGNPSEAELFAMILGVNYPDQKTATELVAAFGKPRKLMTSLTLDTFESFRKDALFHLRLPGSGVEIEFTSICRLIATVELARRYLSQKGPRLPPLKPGMLGIKSQVLVELLAPTSSIDPELRGATIDLLRSHPELDSDFAKLDSLARDADTPDYHRAIELALMFELLRKHPAWAHPSEVLGTRVPFHTLLAIAQARIGRSSRPPTRLLEIKDRLERATQVVPEEPIESFVAALAQLNLPRSIAEKAIDTARHRYIETMALQEASTTRRSAESPR